MKFEKYLNDIRNSYIFILNQYIKNYNKKLKDIKLNEDTNLYDMINVLIGNIENMPIDKSSRWLGFIQAYLAINNIESINDMRNSTRGIFTKIYKENEINYKSIDVKEKKYE